VIVISYADYEEAELDKYAPQVVHVDNGNRPVPADIAQKMATAEPGPIVYQQFNGAG
jgi:aspartate 1-decarboxylase